MNTPNRITPTDNGKRRINKRKAKPAPSPHLDRSARIQASCCFVLAVLLLCISLPHLAGGVQRITHCGLITAWLMACFFDLAMVVCEVALLLIPLLGIKRYAGAAAKGVVITCTIMSAVLNVDAFLQHADNLKGYILATIWGILLPVGVLTLSYIGSAFVLRQKK